MILPSFSYVAEGDLDALPSSSDLTDFEFLYLDTQRATDEVGFFVAVRAGLPLDPPVGSNHRWDALEDSLWEGLFQLKANQIAIIWKGAPQLTAEAPRVGELAAVVLSGIASSLADPKPTRGRVKDVRIYASHRFDR